MLAECSFKNVTPEDLQMVESDTESFDPEVDEKAILAKWKQKALSSRAVNMKKTANGSSCQNRESDKPLQQIIKSSSEKKTRKPQVRKNKEEEEKSKSKAAQKKVRSETAETQSISFGKTMSLDMKLLLHGKDTNRPVEFSIAVEPETTFKTLKSLIAQTTRIPPDNELLVVKGQEWKMDEYERICDDWSTDDLVAIFEEDKT